MSPRPGHHLELTWQHGTRHVHSDEELALEPIPWKPGGECGACPHVDAPWATEVLPVTRSDLPVVKRKVKP